MCGQFRKIPTQVEEKSYLADEVGIVLFGLLADDYSILPDGVITLISLASLKLGDNVKLLLFLLGEILVKGESVVLLFLPARRTAFSFFALGGGSSFSAFDRGRPDISSSGLTPAVGSGGSLCLSISLSGGLCLQLGVALVTAPSLVDLLLRVAKKTGE